MSAAYQELFVEQGADYSTSIYVTDNYDVPLNLTGYGCKSQIRRSYYTNSLVAEFQATITDPLNGGITLRINNANTANISPGRYVYDVIVLDDPLDAANTIITRVMEGIVNVSPSVTVP